MVNKTQEPKNRSQIFLISVQNAFNSFTYFSPLTFQEKSGWGGVLKHNVLAISRETTEQLWASVTHPQSFGINASGSENVVASFLDSKWFVEGAYEPHFLLLSFSSLKAFSQSAKRQWFPLLLLAIHTYFGTSCPSRIIKWCCCCQKKTWHYYELFLIRTVKKNFKVQLLVWLLLIRNKCVAAASAIDYNDSTFFFSLFHFTIGKQPLCWASSVLFIQTCMQLHST